MELKLKDRLLKKGQFETVNSTEKIYQKIDRRTSERASHLTNLGFIPYENTKGYRTDMIELEHARAQALAEAQRMRSRII